MHSAPYRAASLHRTAALLLLLTMPAAGCYNTYAVASDEFRKLQSPAAVRLDAKLAENEGDFQKLLERRGNDAVTVATIDSKQVAVTRDTRVYVKSQGGRRYPVTPFNFSMYSSQLVASDRDTLLPLSTLQSFEVDLLSTGKTAGIIVAGVALAAGFIVVIVASAGDKSYN